MTEQFYYREIDTTNKNEMITFLTTHFRYFTINSWNGVRSYANDIKIYHLGIEDQNIIDKAYDTLRDDIDTTELDFVIKNTIESFERKHKAAVGFNGRSGGYLVLYYTEIGHENNINVFPGKSLGSNDPEYFEDWTDYEIKKLTNLVIDFDKFCDELREIYITFLKASEIFEEEEVIVTTKKVLRKRD